MASDKEYFELMVKNVQKSNADTIGFLKETIGEIKKTQKTNCEDIQELKTNQAKNKGIFNTISQIVSYLWLGVITYFSVNR